MGVLLGVFTLAAIVIVIIVTKRSSSKAPLVLPNAIQVTLERKAEVCICGFVLVYGPCYGPLFHPRLQWPVSRKRPLLYATVSPEETCRVHATARNTEPSLGSSSSCQESKASVSSEGESSDLELASLGGASEDQDRDSQLVSSGYDCPHFLVDMGSGDMVTAYTE